MNLRQLLKAEPMTVATDTRQAVRAYHDARFNGDLPTATAYLADGFTFRSPLMVSDAAGHLAGLPVSCRWSPAST